MGQVERFDSFVCIGDSISWDKDGFTITARVEHDEVTSPHDYDCYDEDQKAAWGREEWHFSGLVLSVGKNGITLDDMATSLWGIESNLPGYEKNCADYLFEVSRELEDEAIAAGRAALDKVCA